MQLIYKFILGILLVLPIYLQATPSELSENLPLARPNTYFFKVPNQEIHFYTPQEFIDNIKQKALPVDWNVKLLYQYLSYNQRKILFKTNEFQQFLKEHSDIDLNQFLTGANAEEIRDVELTKNLSLSASIFPLSSQKLELITQHLESRLNKDISHLFFGACYDTSPYTPERLKRWYTGLIIADDKDELAKTLSYYAENLIWNPWMNSSIDLKHILEAWIPTRNLTDNEAISVVKEFLNNQIVEFKQLVPRIESKIAQYKSFSPEIDSEEAVLRLQLMHLLLNQNITMTVFAKTVFSILDQMPQSNDLNYRLHLYRLYELSNTFLNTDVSFSLFVKAQQKEIDHYIFLKAFLDLSNINIS